MFDLVQGRRRCTSRCAARTRADSHALPIGLCLLGVALVTAGCSSSKPASTGTISITVGIPPAISSDAVALAQDKGYFAKNHLKVSIKTLNGGAATVPALQGGSIQVAQSNVLSEIQGASQGLHVPCFAGAFGLKNPGGFLPLVTSEKSGITEPSQLSGKTIAVNATHGVNQLMTDSWLDQHGVDYKSVHYIGMAFPNMPSAISSNRVSAAVPVEPFATQMVQAGAKLLAGYLESNIPGAPIFSCWNATANWLKSEPKAANSFVAAIEEANQFINTQPDAFRAWLKSNSNLTDKVIQNVAIPHFTTTMSATDVKNWEAEAKVQENDLTRAEGMMKADLITKQELDHARYKLTASQFEVEREKQNQQNAEATLRALQLEQEKMRIVAPFDGVIARRYVRAGQKVSKDDKLFWVTAVSPMKVKFALPEKFAGKVKTGEEITVTSVSMPDEKHAARVTMVSPVVDPSSGTIEVSAELLGAPGELRPGMTANIHLDKQR